MPNVFQNPVTYTMETLRVLSNNLVFSKHVTRKYEDKFAQVGGKIGDTFNLRRPAKFTVRTGAPLGTQDYTETSVPLVINNQKGVDVTWTSADETLKVEEFTNRIIKPAMNQLANQIDYDGLTTATISVGNSSGAAGTVPATAASILDVGKILDNNAAPRDGERYLVISPTTNAALIGGLSGFFNDQRLVGEQYKEGRFVDMTNTLGFKIGMDQNVNRHLNGARGGAPIVSGTQSLTTGWANTTSLLTSGWTAGVAVRAKAGDQFTIANVNSVNPVTKQSTGSLQWFTVTADASSDGAGVATLIISPAIISAGPFQNVDAAALASAPLTFLGTLSVTYTKNIGFHRDAFTLACVDLVDVAKYGAWGARKEHEGISVRVARQYLIASDTVPTRTDVLYGWATPYPELAVQLTE